jgi:phosphatidylcholine synthase
MSKEAAVASMAKRQVRQGWSVHIFTTSGVVVGMLALEAVYRGGSSGAKAAIVFLLITQLIDGIDGPMARQYDVKSTVPKIDGYVLDLVIDYVTCVVVPAAFLHQFHMLPHKFSITLVGLIVFMSAIWFSRTDMMTEDNWFNGFPATWNLVAPTLYILETGKWITNKSGILTNENAKWFNAAIVVLLSALMLTNVKFPHPVRAGEGRNVTLPVTLMWLTALTWCTVRLPSTAKFGRILLIASVVYFVGLSVWRTRRDPLSLLDPITDTTSNHP